MKRKLLRNFTALFTALCIPLSVYTADIPTKSAYARAETSPNVSTYDYYDPTTNSMKSATATAVTSGDTTLTTGWYVLDNSVDTINNRVEINGDVNIIIADGAACTFSRGIRVESGNKLMIWGQSADYNTNGIINVQSDGAENASIGSNAVSDDHPYTDSGLITINGGNVTSHGTFCGAGIGGGRHSHGRVVINGGLVSASSEVLGAAIGGGFQAKGNVTITGGKVTAHSGNEGAAIGGGCEGAGNVKISGGKIWATGTNRSSAIGGGLRNKGGVEISGGEVWANGGDGKSGSIGDGPQGKSKEDLKKNRITGGVFSTGENGNAIVHGSISNKGNQNEWDVIL